MVSLTFQALINDGSCGPARAAFRKAFNVQVPDDNTREVPITYSNVRAFVEEFANQLANRDETYYRTYGLAEAVDNTAFYLYGIISSHYGVSYEWMMNRKMPPTELFNGVQKFVKREVNAGLRGSGTKTSREYTNSEMIAGDYVHKAVKFMVDWVNSAFDGIKPSDRGETKVTY